jgi:hypothetical protein
MWRQSCCVMPMRVFVSGKSAILTLALLVAAPAAAQTSTIVPNEATGNYELRDNSGRVTGYLRPDPAIGGYDLVAPDGLPRGMVIENPATGGYDVRKQPERRR